MAPYHALDSQGSPKQSSPRSVLGNEMLSVSKDSHNVAKPQRRDWQQQQQQQQAPQPQAAPTIRVIHIFAPKVIKTDVANFRSTVQKLTGKSTRKSSSQRRARTKTVLAAEAAAAAACPMQTPGAASNGPFSPLWDQESSQKEVLQRLVVDACGTDHLVRCNSVESTFSLDSSNTSNDTGGELSPSDCSFSFNAFPGMLHREVPYSLGEIPAPFFTGDLQHFGVASPTFGGHSPGVAMGLPNLVGENSTMSLMGFDVDHAGPGLGAPLLSENPFQLIGSASSSGGLYDLMPQQYCRVSAVQLPSHGAFFNESI